MQVVAVLEPEPQVVVAVPEGELAAVPERELAAVPERELAAKT